MSLVSCPDCGEDERLSGERQGDTIHVHCEACGTRWRRDVGRKCRYCGSQNLRYTPIPLWSSGRGTMQTPAGERESYACEDCGGSDVTRRE